MKTAVVLGLLSCFAIGCTGSEEGTSGSAQDLTHNPAVFNDPALFGVPAAPVTAENGAQTDPTAPTEPTDKPVDPTPTPAEKPPIKTPRPNIVRSEVIHQYSGTVRASFDGAEPVVSEWSTPALSFNYSAPAPWSISGPVRIDFGASPATMIVAGTEFSCATGDAKVMSLENDAEGKLIARQSATCSVVIEEVSAPTSDRFVRVWGYFVADSNLPDGLAHQTSGTFAGDFPLPLREAQQPR
jgi:hypothetical protein